MERLTERNGNYVVINMKKHCPFGKNPKWCNFCKIHNHEEQRKVCPVLQMLDRLAAYEDIGLEPKEVKAALRELGRYRELGTVEELNEAAYNASL